MGFIDRLINYFRSRENKYLILDNKAEVKLAYIKVSDRQMELMFEHDYDNIEIKFSFYTPKDEGFVVMVIPDECYHVQKIVVGNMEQIGAIVNKTLYNWTENKDIGLEWRD
ncbi:hypothetical protein [Staphylococcus phage VB-SauS-SA2]|nr:hypothetical protein [Staphylococcus phage VB-SauS-SA2]